MMLIRALGMMNIPDNQLRDNFDKMSDAAVEVLKSGVTITLTEYSMLTNTEKEALLEAGERIKAETAFLIGAAILNPEFQEHLVGEAHGEEGLKDYRDGKAIEKLRSIVDEMMTKRSK